MKTRVVSALICLPILIIFVFLGGNLLKFGILTLSLIAMFELSRALEGELYNLHYILFFFGMIFILWLEEIYYHYFNIFIIIFLLFMLVFLVLNHQKYTYKNIINCFFVFFYVPFMLAHIYLLRIEPYGLYNVWLIFISAWASDTGAYSTGLAFGKHKLIPTLSPKKTIEGALGGIIFTVIISWIYGHFLIKYAFTELPFFVFILSGFFGSIFSQFGDLAASSIKRTTGIKDYGKIIPGHGGIMDRFDSILFTAPGTFIVIKSVALFL